MRKVSIEIAKAFIKGKRKTIGKTHTFTSMQSGGNGYVSLHGNKIAWWENNHPYKNKHGNIHLSFCLCGWGCLLYTSPSPRDGLLSRMPSSA